MLVVGGIVVWSVLRQQEGDPEESEFFRPPIPLPTEAEDLRNPALLSEAEQWEFTPFTVREEEGSDTVLFYGDIVLRPFPVRSLSQVEVGKQDQEIGEGLQFSSEIVQVTRWGPPPLDLLEAGNEASYRQVYSQHLFFDQTGAELTPERAVARFPRVGGDGLYPTERNGSWYQHSFKKQVGIWFRLSGPESESVRLLSQGAVDRLTGFPILGADQFGMGNGDFRIRVSTPFWHNGGLDFVLDRPQAKEPSRKDHDLAEGAVYSMGGFHVQVILFRPGVWETRSLTEEEKQRSAGASIAYAAEKLEERGMTLFAVTDGEPAGRDWMMEVVGVDGKPHWTMQRNGPLLFQKFGVTPRRSDQVEPAKLRMIRGPDKDRFVATLKEVPGTGWQNQDLENLFDQEVPFFYAKNVPEALNALSELISVERGPLDSSLPRKPEGFPLVLRNVTVTEIAEALQAVLETEGRGLRLDQETWQWRYPEVEREVLSPD